MKFLRLIFLSLLAAGSLLHTPSLLAQAPTGWMKDSTARLYVDAVKARMLGNNRESDLLLKQVVQLDPTQSAPYYDLSRLALKANDAALARDYIQKALALDSSNKWYQEQYANTLVLSDEPLAAAEVYQRLASKEQINEEYLERSANLFQRAGKYKEALAQLELLRKKSDESDVLLKEEAVYLKMNDVDGAARTLRELIRLNPREPRYYGMLAEMYQSNKEPKKAEAVIEEMSQKFPNDPSLQINLATQALRKGDTVTYRNHLKNAILNKELSADMQLYLLRSYLAELPDDNLQQKEALSIAKAIVVQHPEDVSLLSFYAYVLGLNGDQEQAAVELKTALSLKKDDYSIWQQLLYLYTDPKNADSLIKWSRRAARLFPNQAQVHYLNGIGYYNKKDYSAAIRSIERAIDLEPEEKADELSEMHTILGDIYNSTKEFALSDSNYNVALRLNPKNATVLNNYAYYLSLRRTRLDDAERMSLKSLELRPHEATFQDTYAWILYQQGKYQEALSHIQEALGPNKDNNSPELWEHLAAIQYKLGNKAAAVEAWKKARALGSENANLDKMIAEQKLYE